MVLFHNHNYNLFQVLLHYLSERFYLTHKADLLHSQSGRYNLGYLTQSKLYSNIPLNCCP